MPTSFVTDSTLAPRARTSIAGALEQLRQCPFGFTTTDQATLSVIDLSLPNGRTVPSPALHFRSQHAPDHVFVAMLALATHCWATRTGLAQREKLEVRLLAGALVDSEGRATLGNGETIRAIEMIPSGIPNPSTLDWQILRALIAARGAKDQCYRSVTEGIPPRFAAQVPGLASIRCIDCSRLSILKPQLLKQDLDAVQRQDKVAGDITEEKLAQTLAMFGIRTRKPRRRPN
jgi:hypothetical protein